MKSVGRQIKQWWISYIKKQLRETVHFLPLFFTYLSFSVFLKENIWLWSTYTQRALPYPRICCCNVVKQTRQVLSFLFWDSVHDPAGAGLHVRVDHGSAGLRLSGADWPGPQQLSRFHLHKGIVHYNTAVILCGQDLLLKTSYSFVFSTIYSLTI